MARRRRLAAAAAAAAAPASSSGPNWPMHEAATMRCAGNVSDDANALWLSVPRDYPETGPFFPPKNARRFEGRASQGA